MMNAAVTISPASAWALGLLPLLGLGVGLLAGIELEGGLRDGLAPASVAHALDLLQAALALLLLSPLGALACVLLASRRAARRSAEAPAAPCAQQVGIS